MFGNDACRYAEPEGRASRRPTIYQHEYGCTRDTGSVLHNVTTHLPRSTRKWTNALRCKPTNDVSRIVTKVGSHRSMIAWSPSPISNGTRALRRSALIALTMALHIWAALTMALTDGPSGSSHALLHETNPKARQPTDYCHHLTPLVTPTSPSSMRTPSGAPNPTGRMRSSHR